ncbi:NitT/TauT family transport system substrate-binding protein [Rathayibacter sp. PhB93]|uniref:ABC transporter substrate-binding protein n=1 Tax=unclassified Rathayibacter TaxID=2609250 RepID=UPI000FB11DCD|nr:MULTISPECIES: ABC transporter substrate-binding protein [unclassified Rathayibacter]ROQ16990.1 NitT/TauT family transport system substrate-binding protein [Rathayibacter sp. PhB93]TDQ06794.1 NitT/TauT family transport system substrate-binding protein [Rathayibacter sp. PhB1]
MPAPLLRRAPRAVLALLAGACTVGLLAGCAGSDSSASEGGGTQAATLQLGWIANVENMGPFIGERDGDYADAGVDITITPGGPSTTVEPLVASGKALVGLSSADVVARARNEGAPLVIVGATLQVNPMSIMSLASSPVNTLDDLVGSRLCIQTSGVSIMDGILTANDIEPSDVEYVTADFDPSPLVAGDCDAFVSFLNNQPVTLKLQGIDTVAFPLSDYGYEAWGNVLFTTEEALADETQRAAVKAVVEGTVAGWTTALADPDDAAAYVVDGPGKSQNLDLEQQKLAAKAFVPLVQTAETEQNGLLTMSPEGIAANIATLEGQGVEGDLDSLFDTSILDEIHAG